MLRAIWLSLWPAKITNANGLSNSTGFEITFTDPANQSQAFYTRSYNPKLEEDRIINPNLKKAAIFYWALSIPYGVLCLWALDVSVSFLVMTAIGAVCFTFIANFLNMLREFHKATELREWHACEHKSIALLQLGLSPTPENLRSMPSVSIHCGTSQLGIVFLEGPLYILLIAWSSVGSMELRYVFAWIFLLGAGWLILCAVLALLSLIADLFSPTKSHYLNLVIGISFAPLAFVPCILEKLFVLKEPSDKKILDTAEDLRWLILKYNLYKID